MSNSSLVPLLVVFLVEDVLIYDIYRRVRFPCTFQNGKIIDSYKKVIEPNPNVTKVFERLKNESIKIALIDSVIDCPVKEITQIVDWLGWNKYVSYAEIDFNTVMGNLENIQKKSGIPFKRMLYFTPWTSPAYEKNREVVYSEVDVNGISMEALDKGFKEYERWVKLDFKVQ